MKYSPRKILGTGLLAGTLDITAACLQYYIKTGKGPSGVLKFVASGWFGQKALEGGNTMIAAGLAFHYLIAMGVTVFFFITAGFWFSVFKNKWLTGIAYGIFVWCITNLIIVPLSATPKFPFKPINAWIAAAILILCIGLPLSFSASKKGKNTD